MPEHSWASTLLLTAHADLAARPTQPCAAHCIRSDPERNDVVDALVKEETERAPRLPSPRQRLLILDRSGKDARRRRLDGSSDAVRPELDGIISRVHKVIPGSRPAAGRQGLLLRRRHLGVTSSKPRSIQTDRENRHRLCRRATLRPRRGRHNGHGVAWKTDIAGPRQVRRASAEGSSSVAPTGLKDPSRARLPCGAALRRKHRLRCLSASMSSASPALQPPSHPATLLLDKLAISSAQSASQCRTPGHLSANSEKAKRRLDRSRSHRCSRTAVLACYQPRHCVDHGERRRNVELRGGYEVASQRRG